MLEGLNSNFLCGGGMDVFLDENLVRISHINLDCIYTNYPNGY